MVRLWSLSRPVRLLAIEILGSDGPGIDWNKVNFDKNRFKSELFWSKMGFFRTKTVILLESLNSVEFDNFSRNSQFLSIKGITIGITVWLRACPTPVRAITWHPKKKILIKIFVMKLSAVFWVFSYPSFIIIYTACFGAVKLSANDDVIRRLITSFVLIYLTVYCWDFFIFTEHRLFPLILSRLKNIRWFLMAFEGDAIKVWISRSNHVSHHVWFYYPLCHDQFNSSLQIE